MANSVDLSRSSSHLSTRFGLWFGAACALALLLLGASGDGALSAQGASCLPPISNPIACENALTGNPQSEWDVTGAGDATIQGYTTDISVNHGQTVSFKVKTDASQYRLDIYRLGYYSGAGARKVATVLPSASLPQTQPACLTDAATGLIDCGNWAVSASWAVPVDATSGVYIARLVRIDTGGASHMVFVVRDDEHHADLLFQTADTTWQAYNDYGGNSLYAGAPAGRAYKVSYNRPFVTRGNQYARAWLFDGDYPMIRWLEANGYFVSYATGVDTDRQGAELLEHKAFLSVGHDEYWSGAQRTNVEAARAAGVHLAFFSGNEMFWKTRWEASISAPATTYRTLVSYKETHANAKIDPSAEWTGTWRDARFSPPADGGRPENALTGTIFMGNCCPPSPMPLTVSAAQGKARFWRNTTVANLTGNQTTTVAAGIIGYEFDADLENGFRPQGLVRLSTSTFAYASMLLDNGSTYGAGSITHALTLYRHSSGALVFGAGTTRWAWALDTTHDQDSATPNTLLSTIPIIQQATVNLLADMGSQPLTLQSGLVASGASIDTSAPTAAITSPSNGSSVSVGTPFTATGTAADSGGGVVVGVEVSLDNGVTWKMATGLANWTFAVTAPSQTGSMTIRSRAIDDSGNIGAASSVTLTVTPAVCPCTLWPASSAPAFFDTADTSAIELGVKFSSDVSGYITGLRFYKGTTTTGTHVGSLWSSAGALLATATFAGETASGWQQVSFATPVAISANVQYVASYHTNVGNYAYDPNYFATTGVDRTPLHAPSEPASGGNGVYIYGVSAFPSQVYHANNYWVDVVFNQTVADTTPPTITARVPSVGATGVSTATTVTATFSESMLASSITTSTVVLRTPANVVVPATVSYSSGTNTATLTPTAVLAAATTYTATVVGGSSGVKDLAGNALAGDVAWSFTTAAPDTTPPTVSSTTPATAATGVSIGTTVSATFSEAVQASTITTATVVLRTPANVVVPATVSYTAGTNTATLAPTSVLTALTTYTATIVSGSGGVKDLAGNALAVDRVWSFTTGPATNTLWPTSATPAFFDTADVSAIELGVKFSSDTAGYITGVRFYKGTTTTGTHVGNLWSSGGALLATATFANETASGWQEVTFSPAVAISAGVQYVASYHTNVGNYAYDPNYFATTGVDSPPLHAPSEPASGGNGVYIYGASAFPSQIYHANNYWVDVVFSLTQADTTPPTVSSTTPATGATGVSAATTVTATFSEGMLASTITTGTVVLRTPANVVVPATVTYTAGTNTATLTPTSALAASTTYTATVVSGSSGVKDLAGNALAVDRVWSFTTAAADTTPPTVSSTTPASGATGVSAATTVTATFSEAMLASTITTSTVVLRTPANVVVPATVTYTAGTNTATLTPTSALAASTTYTATVVSGSSGVKDLAGNALAVDRVWSFTTAAAVDTTPPTVSSTTPASGATGVSAATTVTATFSEAMLASTITTSTVVLRTPANVVVPATVTYTAGTNTATLTPTSALTASTTYTATVVSGSSGVKDLAGNALAVDRVWSFTTAAAGPPPTTLGLTTIGAVTDTDDSNFLTGSLVTTVAASAVSSMSVYVGGIDASTTNRQYQLAIYTNSAGKPGTLVASSASATLAANSWNTVAVSASLQASTPYWLLFNTNGLTSTVNDMRYDVGAAGQGVFSNASVAFGTWPATFPTSTLSTAIYSLYATVSTIVDTTPPTITARAPAVNATGVSPTTTVTATFSESMLASTVTTSTVVLRTPANVVVPATVTYTAGTNTATLTPTSALTTSTVYTATVVGGSAGVKDLAGNALAIDAVWSFTTAAPDTTPPTVSSTTPATGATGVGVGTTVTATFSEAMLASTITTSTVVLRTPANVVVPATVTYTAGTNTATLTPTSALAGSTTYTATVVSGSSGVKDLAGNALAVDRVWSFTTSAVPPLGLTTIGASADSDDSNYLTGSLVTTTTAGTVTAMSVYVGAIDASTTNRQYQLAIYTNVAGKPGTLVASSAAGTLAANSWNTVAITAALQAGTSYWLIYNSNGVTSTVNNLFYDTGAAGQGIYSNAKVTYGTWPATFPASTLTTARYSLYATW